MNRSQIRDLAVLFCLLFFCFASRALLLLTRGFEIFDADHTIIGLMGKHILEGHPMIYCYGQGYMGSLEAFMAALLYCFFGMNPFSLQAAPFVFYLLFLCVTFHLLKKTFGSGVSLLTVLFLTLSPPAMTLLSVTALGGYPETLFFGALILLGFVAFREKPKASVLFWTGVAAGVGFWVNNLIMLYFISVFILFFLQSSFWRGKNLKNSTDAFVLKDLSIPAPLKWVAIVIHSFVLFLILWNLTGFLTGGDHLSIGPFNLPLPEPIFHIKKVKKILLLLTIEWLVILALQKGLRGFWQTLREKIPLAAGFAAGAFPVFLFSILGGEGYRVVHSSAIIYAKELPDQVHIVIFQGLLQSILGIPVAFLTSWHGGSSLYAWGLSAVYLGLFLIFAFHQRREIKSFVCLEGRNYSYSFFPLLLIFTTIMVCLLSTLKADRYLVPAYFAFSVIFAWTLIKLYATNRFWAILIFLFLIIGRIYSNVDSIRSIRPRTDIQKGYESVIDFLEKEKISGAYAIYVRSYPITFLSREKIIVAPYRSPDRYPAYTHHVDGMDRVAYILHEEDAPYPHLQKALDKNRISYRKTRIGPFWVYTIDRRKKSEKAFV